VKFSLKASTFASIAIITGLIVLLGYFIQIPLLADLSSLLLGWAVALTAVALLLGVLNLLRVHWGKIKTRQSGFAYSFILIISMLLTILIVGFLGPTATYSMWIFNYIQVPIEASLMALLAILLIFAAARLFSRRINLFTFLFIAAALLVLVTIILPPWFQIPGLNELRSWIAQSGARGILLGVALGTIATGLRVLTGADRPYEGG
jgi:hypothetical protein